MNKIPKKLSLVFLSLASFILFGLLSFSSVERTPLTIHYTGLLKHLSDELDQFGVLCKKKESLKNLKIQFIRTRQLYKRLAVLSEYFNPYETKFLNGPALNRVEEDNFDAIIPPHGFQLLEEYLYKGWNKDNYRLIEEELKQMSGTVARLQNERDIHLKFKDEYVFEALRSSVIRLMALGISGFDSPVAQHSLSEAKQTIRGMEEVILIYRDKFQGKSEMFQELLDRLGSALDMLSHKNFNSFDRLTFIKEHGNPIYEKIGKIRIRLDLPSLQGRMPVNPYASSIFGDSAFNIDFFSPDEQYQVTPERIALGKRLFYDPVLSQSGDRHCGSCHKPELGFTDGLRVPLAVQTDVVLTRNTPGLWNSVFQTRLFYDSRTDALENQLDEVVHNADEMNGSLKQSAAKLKSHAHYSELFKAAYSKDRIPVTSYTIANAISSYVRSLVALNSRFDQYITDDATSLTADEKKGFNLFMGKAKCGTCHFIPLFNGLIPPEFNETESEVLGVPAVGKKELDPDPGKFGFTTSVIHKNSFKTPTLRNVAITAPYMHNGVFKTLDEVMDFYNDGGGAGMGLPVENQTLPSEKLGLSTKEKKQVIAFMRALTDTTAKN